MTNAKHFLIIDTETKGIDDKFIYDIGWTIVNKKGDILQAREYLVREIITNADIMRDAYYNKKIYSHYIPKLDINFAPLLRNWSDIIALLREDINTYNPVLCAYNFAFDSRAIRDTSDFLGTGRVLPDASNDFLDLWLFACQNLFTQRNYKKLARRLGWISDAGNFRTTAEHAYRYISSDWNFEESHTALDDALIESEIFADLMRNKRTIPYNILHPMPWRLAQA